MPYKRIVVDGVKHYGKHVILTAAGCNDALLEKTAIADFCRDMVKRIDMVPFGEPFVERFGGGDEVGIFCSPAYSDQRNYNSHKR
jgi:hypothetical protein